MSAALDAPASRAPDTTHRSISAELPFEGEVFAARSDCTLVTRDGHHHHVHRLVLSLHSKVFNDLFVSVHEGGVITVDDTAEDPHRTAQVRSIPRPRPRHVPVQQQSAVCSGGRRRQERRRSGPAHRATRQMPQQQQQHLGSGRGVKPTLQPPAGRCTPWPRAPT